MARKVGAPLEAPDDDWKDIYRLYPGGLVTAIHNATVGRLPLVGLNYLARCLREPSRNTESTPKSSAGIYPSRILMRTIGFDSSTVELPTILRKEADPRCIAVLNQAPQITLRVRSGHRWAGYQHRPDFLCVELDRSVLIECKTLTGIQQRNDRNENFFVYEGGRWTCPAAVQEAAKYGLEYEVWTDLDFSDVELRNAGIIAEYLRGHTDVYDRQVEVIRSYMARGDARTLQQVLDDLAGEVTTDALYAAIARGAVAFELNATPLTKLSTCEIFRDEPTMRAHLTSRAKPLLERAGIKVDSFEVCVGSQVIWNGARWRCMAIADNKLMFARKADVQPIPLAAYQPLSITTFMLMVRSGEMTIVETSERDTMNDRVAAILQSATRKEIEEANRRHVLVIERLVPGAPPSEDRSVRRYIESYKRALHELGNGYVGLIPMWRGSGNRTPRIETAVLSVVKELINDHYLTPERPSALSVYRRIKGELNDGGYMVPSYRWFCDLINSIPDYEASLARTGVKGAYKFEPRVFTEAHRVTPIAERAFAHAHVDHTEIDLVVKTDGESVRMYLTVMLCSATRRVLASTLSFEPPSYRQVLLVFRDCVRRHARLPETIVVDGGKEFRSCWFECVCALYQVLIRHRATSKPRYGAEMERLFGTTNTALLHTLIGNTQNTREVRQLTADTDPYRRALWTLSAVVKIIENFFFEVYNNKLHVTLLMSPCEAAAASQALYGTAPHRFVSFNETFLILTSATTKKGAATVQPDGVKIKYLYYNHPRLRPHLGELVPVRFDPFNISNAWAQVGGAWLKLTSRYASVLVNHSEHDVIVVTEAWRRRRKEVERETLSESCLIDMLKELSLNEEWLQQRQRSHAERELRSSDACSVYGEAVQPVQEIEQVVCQVVSDSQSSRPTQRAQRLQIASDLLALEVLK